jgi:hypothetical protein
MVTHPAWQNIEPWPIERVEYPRNLRKNDSAVDSMCASIHEFGIKIPCLVRSDGAVVVPVPITLEDRPQSSDGLQADLVSVSAEYFTATGTPLLHGRIFLETDQIGAPPVTLVDRFTARRFWPNQSAIGKRVKIAGTQSQQPWATIVGIVGDIRHDGIAVDGIPHLYFPIYQRVTKVLGVVLRGSRRFGLTF